METDKGPTPSAGTTTDVTDKTDSFTTVKSKRCQKRKLEQDGVDMDTQASVTTKRPTFPPISGDELKVNTACKRFVTNVFKKLCLVRFVFVAIEGSFTTMRLRIVDL